MLTEWLSTVNCWKALFTGFPSLSNTMTKTFSNDSCCGSVSPARVAMTGASSVEIWKVIIPSVTPSPGFKPPWSKSSSHPDSKAINIIHIQVYRFIIHLVLLCVTGLAGVIPIVFIVSFPIVLTNYPISIYSLN